MNDLNFNNWFVNCVLCWFLPFFYKSCENPGIAPVNWTYSTQLFACSECVWSLYVRSCVCLCMRMFLCVRICRICVYLLVCVWKCKWYKLLCLSMRVHVLNTVQTSITSEDFVPFTMSPEFARLTHFKQKRRYNGTHALTVTLTDSVWQFAAVTAGVNLNDIC